MRHPRIAVSLHGLHAQVLLWTVLPVTLLMIVYSLSAVQSHQNSMRALAIEEKTRLVSAYAQTIALELEIYQLRQGAQSLSAVHTVLPLDDILQMQHPHVMTSFVLLDEAGNILFMRGDVPDQTSILAWDGVEQALTRNAGYLFTSHSEHGDIVAYAPVENSTWVLLIREPWHSLSDPLIRFEQVMPVILLTAVTVSLLILFFGLRYIVRPLQDLGARVSNFGRGNFQALSSPVGGVKEIEDLQFALSDMAARVQTYQGALHNYLGAVTRTQEEERARLARELHDETVQTLIALGHKAQMAQRSYQRGGEHTDTLLHDLRQMIAQAIEEVRRFSQALRPVYLEELGLLAALQILAREAKAEFHIEGKQHHLESQKETILYRVAQEALNNALYHSQATNIKLRLVFETQGVLLRVEDDGVGFAVPTSYALFTQQGHFGMMGMYERALQINAQLDVISTPGQGTSVQLILPVAKQS